MGARRRSSSRVQGKREAERRADRAAPDRPHLTDSVGSLQIQRAEAMVLATEQHGVPAGLSGNNASDCALLLDFDMAIPGAGSEVYRRYAEGVAAEYAPYYDNAAYCSGRARFLAGVLQKQRIFLTDAFEAILAAEARINMEKELSLLRPGRLAVVS